MTKTVSICDRCNNETAAPAAFNVVVNRGTRDFCLNVKVLGPRECKSEYDLLAMDLCELCRKDLQMFLRGSRDGDIR